MAIHAAILIPIALNTVFLPQWEPNERTFEVWIDMPIAEPVRDRIIPTPQPVPVERQQTEQEPVQETVTEQIRTDPVPEPIAQPQRPEQQTLTRDDRTQIEALNRQMPQLAPQPAPSEVMDDPSPASPVAGLTGLPAVSLTRPHIESIDGPSPARDVRPLSGNASLPGVSMPSTSVDTNAAGSSTSEDLDAPVPRRARMTKEEEAALAAAAASGALDDAWVYRPSPGESGGGTPPAGGAAGNTVGQSGTVVFRGTPVDCTQPRMLSDVQRLSCDSAEQRRLQSSMERMGTIIGSGDAERDARQRAQGDQRLNDYERRRQPLRAGVGVSQGSMLGGSERGEVLDEMSGTNREVEKLQDAMRRSSAPRLPSPSPAPSSDDPDI